MELTHTSHSRDDLDKINERIKELTANLKEVNDEQDERYGHDRQLTANELVWIKELRQLRRIRDANDKIQS